METDNFRQINATFQELKSEADSIFAIEFWYPFENRFSDFHLRVDATLRKLPCNSDTTCEIYAWASIVQDRIQRTTKNNKSQTSASKLKARKDLLKTLNKIRNEFIQQSSQKPEPSDGPELVDASEKLTIKQQILLLEALGVLSMEKIQSLPDTKKARLFSHLLNRGEKKIKDFFTYMDKDKPEYYIYKDENLKKVNDLLKSSGLQEYKLVGK